MLSNWFQSLSGIPESPCHPAPVRARGLPRGCSDWSLMSGWGRIPLPFFTFFPKSSFLSASPPFSLFLLVFLLPAFLSQPLQQGIKVTLVNPQPDKNLETSKGSEEIWEM